MALSLHFNICGKLSIILNNYYHVVFKSCFYISGWSDKRTVEAQPDPAQQLHKSAGSAVIQQQVVEIGEQKQRRWGGE